MSENLEKVGDLRDIAILVQLNFGIFDIYWSAQNLVKLSLIIILYLYFMGLLQLGVPKSGRQAFSATQGFNKDAWDCPENLLFLLNDEKFQC